MKKRIFALLSVGLAFTVCLAGCDKTEPTPEEHTHTFSQEWTTDAENHWHAATCDHADQQSGKAAHNLEIIEDVNNTVTCVSAGKAHVKCTVCGYEDLSHDVPALGHSFVKQRLSSCTEPTRTVEVCTRCGAEQHEHILGMSNGHQFDTEDLTTNVRYHYAACTVCGEIKADSLGQHTIQDGVCSGCGYTRPEGYQEANAALAANFTIEFLTNEHGPNEFIVKGLSEAGQEETELEIPYWYKGQLGEGYVTAIDDYAFQGAAFTKITVPDSIDTIGEQAFADCDKLTTFTVPFGVTKIDDGTFNGCVALASVDLGKRVTSIRPSAFADCTSLTAIEIPNTVTYIGMRAFSNTGLTSVVVPASVVTMDSSVFRDCKQLTAAEVNIARTSAESCRNMGGWFAGCVKLNSLTLPYVGSHAAVSDSYVENPSLAFAFGTSVSPSEASNYTEVDGFYVPNSLKKVIVLGGTVTADSFKGCSMLTAITLKNGVNVQATTFEGCTASVIVG